MTLKLNCPHLETRLCASREIEISRGTEYSYRSGGLRASKTVGSTTTYFLYDGDRVLCELNSSGTVINTFAYGPAGLVERYSPGDGQYYVYTFDPSGNLCQRQSQNGLYYADYTTTYSAVGTQLGCINPNTEAEYHGPDMVGFGGEWGYYTDNETNQANNGGASQVRAPLAKARQAGGRRRGSE